MLQTIVEHGFVPGWDGKSTGVRPALQHKKLVGAVVHVGANKYALCAFPDVKEQPKPRKVKAEAGGGAEEAGDA
jgi:hypothetical protein